MWIGCAEVIRRVVGRFAFGFRVACRLLAFILSRFRGSLRRGRAGSCSRGEAAGLPLFIPRPRFAERVRECNRMVVRSEANGLLAVRFAGLTVLVGLVLVVAWGPIRSVVEIGMRDDNSSYVLAVPLLAGVLAWVRRKQIAAAPRSGHWVGPVLMVLGLGLYLLSYPLENDTFWYASPVVMMIGAVGAVWGLPVLVAAGPAVVMLLFVVPLPALFNHAIAVPLQTVASVATVELLNTAGVPVERMGNLLTINDKSVNVAEACSGMRSTFALLVLMYTLVFIRRFRWGLRIGLFLLAPVIAIICNLFRIVPVTVAYGYAWDDLADQMHDWLGFVAFGVAILLCLGVISALQWAGVRVLQPKQLAGGTAEAASAASPEGVSAAVAWLRAGRPMLTSVALSALVLVGMGAAIYSPGVTARAEAHHAEVRASVERLPMELAGWEGTFVPLTAPAQDLLKPNAVYSVEFRHAEERRAFKVSLIHCQRARDMNYHEPAVCYPNSGWRNNSAERRVWQTSNGAVEGSEYTFFRILNGGPVQLRVANFFVMPDGEIVASAQTVRERTKLPWVDRFGVAQIQLVFDMRFPFPEKERDRLVVAFLEQSWEALRVIQSGIDS